MTHLQMIIEKLLQDGEVSRNWALKRYITRLTSRIYDLKCLSWDFETTKVPTIKPNGENGWDYVYRVKKVGFNPYATNKKDEGVANEI